MVFSSLLFLFRFLPLCLLVYYCVPKRYKNAALLLFSLVFYSWGEVRYLPVMLSVIVVNYYLAVLIEKNRGKAKIMKTALIGAVIYNFGMLAFFKYVDFFIVNISGLFSAEPRLIGAALPLGISFYTFQIMSYTIDVYRGDVPAERNIIDFGAFVVLFPQLIAGPIVRYTDIRSELKNRNINAQQIETGVGEFIKGLSAKVLIANNVGALWTTVMETGFQQISTPLAWLGIAAYTFQIYFDFSGYSLMSIGLGKMLGFDFPENFNYPYISRSITEFWRRWHITLSSWFREYLYIPLGGNRVSAFRRYFNLFVVWAVTGFWHGAGWNFILWGLYYYVLLIIEKAFLLEYLQKSRVISHIYTLLLIVIGWALFDITSMPQLLIFIKKLFSFVPGSDWLYYFRNYGVSLAAAAVFSTPVTKVLSKRIKSRVLKCVILTVLLLVSTAYLVDESYNPFLYFRF